MREVPGLEHWEGDPVGICRNLRDGVRGRPKPAEQIMRGQEDAGCHDGQAGVAGDPWFGGVSSLVIKGHGGAVAGSSCSGLS